MPQLLDDEREHDKRKSQDRPQIDKHQVGPRQTYDQAQMLEQLSVRRAGRLAITRPRLLTGLVRSAVPLAVGGGGQHRQRGAGRALDRTDAIGRPFVGLLEAVRLKIAA